MSLKDKIRKDVELQEKAHVNWDATKKEWLDSIDSLYGTIKNWFGDYEKEKLASFSASEKHLNEEYLGSYNAKVFHINFANGKEIIIEPIGRLIIGAVGRLDIYVKGFKTDRFYIIRYKDEGDVFSWHLVNKTQGRIVSSLTKDVLEKTFEEWLS